MKTKDEVIQKITELTATVNDATRISRTEAQDLSLKVALRIASASQTIVLLIDSRAFAEAHTICRLLFEHFFNFGALLQEEKHRDVLVEHSTGESSRQLTKITQQHEKSAMLTPENYQNVKEYLTHPDRSNTPKTGLNWEQIAKSGGD